MMRPITAAQDPSPAPLRLALRPKAGGLENEFVKRQGPRRDEPLFLLPVQIVPVRRVQPQPEVAAVARNTATVHVLDKIVLPT
jgi:protein ImuA